MGVETIKRQTRAAYGCLVAGKSSLARVKSATYRLYACSVCDTIALLQLWYAACGTIQVLHTFAFAFVCVRSSSLSSCDPVVSTVGLGSESSPGTAMSEEAYRPRFTIDSHHGLCISYVRGGLQKVVRSCLT